MEDKMKLRQTFINLFWLQLIFLSLPFKTGMYNKDYVH